MRATPEKRQARKLRWVTVLLLLLAAMLLAPFLLTTPLVRLALGQVFPARHASVGSAVLSLSGTLILTDLVLHDTGELAQQPLISAREVHAAFGWAELLSRRMRRIHANGVTVYARPTGPSPLSLLDLFFESTPSGPPAESGRGTLPIWIDTLDVHGMIHLEPMRGVVPASAGWALAGHMTMSGDRMDPSRRFRLAIGETRQLPEESPAIPSLTAPEPPPTPDMAFGLLMEVETQPKAGGTRVVVHRLAARDAALTIEADILRHYIPKLPAELQGPIDADLRALDVSGVIGAGMGEMMNFRGNIRVHDLNAHSPPGGTQAFALDRLTAVGSVEWPLKPWAPAGLKVRDGELQWARVSYHDAVLNTLEASWRLDGETLMIEPIAAEIFDGHVNGLLAWDLSTHAMPACDMRLKSIDMHAVLAHLSPEHLDAEGSASGFLRVVFSAEGELSGRLELEFDGPGTLRIGEIEAVKQMLVGNVGLALANLALEDLQEYPFTEGRLSLESSGKNSELKIAFVRQPRDEADVTPPHQEIINGQEVWVGSVVVPKIDMTIPITGTSLAEILSIASGFRPLDENISDHKAE
jgi:Dicarboxylate transport